MVAPVALFAVATLEKVADLRLVDSLGDTEISIAVSERAVLVIAATLQERPAELCLLQVWSGAELIGGVRISAIYRGTLPTLKKSAHFSLCELMGHRIVLKFFVLLFLD